MQTTSVRIDVHTHQGLKVLAEQLHLSVGETVRYALRRVQQERLGADLSGELTTEDVAWLDADLG